MKKVFLVSGLSLMVSLSAIGHTIRSQDNVNVSHFHFGICMNSSTCPESDAHIEASSEFLSRDRFHSSTYEYNCHGRTFDNRGSWVNHSDAWIFGSGNQSVLYPQIGDVIVWYKPGVGSTSSMLTTHTATIIGPWNGLNTMVSSKYGPAGEYHHALSNTVEVYKDDYRIVRLNTTNVYSKNNSNIYELSKNMPYYKNNLVEMEELKKSNKTLNLHEKFKELPLNKKRINKQNILSKNIVNQNDIEYLFFDLVRDRSVLLSFFNLPDFTEDLVTEIESGKLLLEIVRNNPELSQEIGDKLKEIIMSRSHDTVRGIAMYYLSEVEKISGLYWDIGGLFPEVLENPHEMLYFDYYLNKSYSNN